ncbi:MAG: hypothetical protein MJ180_01680, partial [Candidatus Gastranaerophilales bacterium]|nr:hypothetical protein [Candidatus Gastranaerophilales bacterium]
DAIIESIMNIAKRYPEKLNVLQNIFRLTEEDMKKIANNDFSCIKNSCYFNNALYRTRDMLTFFGKEDLAKLGDITLGTTKMCQTNPAIGKTIKNLIKDSGQELLNYKGWFAKVGIAFVAVCGLTALAISQIGKKNEFNPDKYIERSKA